MARRNSSHVEIEQSRKRSVTTTTHVAREQCNCKLIGWLVSFFSLSLFSFERERRERKLTSSITVETVPSPFPFKRSKLQGNCCARNKFLRKKEKGSNYLSPQLLKNPSSSQSKHPPITKPQPLVLPSTSVTTIPKVIFSKRKKIAILNTIISIKLERRERER